MQTHHFQDDCDQSDLRRSRPVVLAVIVIATIAFSFFILGFVTATLYFK